MLKKTSKVPTINISFEDGTHRQWKKYSEAKLLREVTVYLNQKTKSEGRAVGSVRVVYAKDPQGDFYTRFSFFNTDDCIYKLKPTIEKELLRWFYE